MLERKKRHALAQNQRYTSKCGENPSLILLMCYLCLSNKHYLLFLFKLYLDMGKLIQEEKDAEIKRLRQSLNFKAKPISGFYRAHGSKTPSEKVDHDTKE